MRSNTNKTNKITTVEKQHNIYSGGESNKTGKSYIKPYRERTTNDFFCERWYYIQVSYKGDHELLGYQPCEEGEGRDVNLM